MSKQLFICILIILMSKLLADDSTTQKQKINMLDQEISEIRLNIISHEKQQKSIEELLKTTEEKIDYVSNQLYKINSDIILQENKLKLMLDSKSTLNKNLKNKNLILLKSMTKIYNEMQHAHINWHLQPRYTHKENMDTYYYKFFIQSLNKQLRKDVLRDKNLSDSLNLLKIEQNKLLLIKNNFDKQNYELEKLKKEHEHMLNVYSEKLSENEHNLASLENNKKKLENSIRILQIHRKNFIGSFDKARGHLNMPVEGNIKHEYGEHIADTDQTRDGIIISCRLGAHIKSVAAGKVVFKNWMPGYGLMLIIDHGNNYLSLYARNEHILVNVNDTVAKNQLIATAGQSGGHQYPSLYFALRLNGKPLNPKDWLQAYLYKS